MEVNNNYDIVAERNIIRNLLQNINFAKEVFTYDTIQREYFTDVFHIDAYRIAGAYYRKYGALPDISKFKRYVKRYMTFIQKYEKRSKQLKLWLGAAERVYRTLSESDMQKVEADKDLLIELYELRNIQFALVQSGESYTKGDTKTAIRIFQDVIAKNTRSENIISDGNIVDDLEQHEKLYKARKRKDIEPVATGIFGVIDPDENPRLFKLDNAFAGGYYPGEFIMYVGDNNVGKSTALMETGLVNSNYGKNVLIVTIEMPKEAQEMRIYSRLTGIKFDKFRAATMSDKEYAKWITTVRKFERSKNGILHISAMEGNVTVGAVEDKLREVEALYNKRFEVLIIDYLNDMSAEGVHRNKSSKDWDVLGTISWGLTSLAKKWNNRRGIVVVTANQRKTAAFGSKGKLQDAAYSPLPTQHASIVINIAQNDVDRELERLEWEITKGRFGKKNITFYTYPRFEVSMISSKQRIKDEINFGGYDE